MPGGCILFWESDPRVEGAHNQRAVVCLDQVALLKRLLRVALEDPESLSSTDRNTILSSLDSAQDLVTNTRFLVGELERRSL